jgi:hypothetical protein
MIVRRDSWTDTEGKEGQSNQGAREDENCMSAQTLENVFDPKHVESPLLVNWLDTTSDGKFFTGLRACAAAAENYSRLPDATIATKIVSNPLSNAKWIPKT